MKHVKMIFFAVFFTIIMSAASFAASYSPNWYQENGRWRIKDDNGNTIKDALLCDSASGQDKWYVLNSNGDMVVCALVQNADGNYFSLETNPGENYGALRCQSGCYDGIYLQIDPSSGKIQNQSAITTLKNNRNGIFYIRHSNFVYTNTFLPSVAASVSFGSTSTNDIFRIVQDFEKIKSNGELLAPSDRLPTVRQIAAEANFSNIQWTEKGIYLLAQNTHTHGTIIFWNNNYFEVILAENAGGEKTNLYYTVENIRKALNWLNS